MDKRQERLNQQLNDLEETFFKHVADDNDQLEQIKQRGDHGQQDGHSSAVKEHPVNGSAVNTNT